MAATNKVAKRFRSSKNWFVEMAVLSTISGKLSILLTTFFMRKNFIGY
jgi:hypothetical protein